MIKRLTRLLTATAVALALGWVLGIFDVKQPSGSILSQRVADVPRESRTEAQEIIHPDPDSARVYRVRSELLTFLKERLDHPSSIGLATGDHLYRIALAFYEVANKTNGLVVFRSTLGKRSAFAASGLGSPEFGKLNDQVYVNSTYFEPLLRRAENDPFYADILMRIVVKEGSLFVNYDNPLDRMNLTFVRQFAVALEQHPVLPTNEIQRKTIRIVAGGLDESETGGFESVIRWNEAHPFALEHPHDEAGADAALAEVVAAAKLLVDQYDQGRNRNEKELRIRSRVLWAEISLSYPHLYQAVKALPELRNVRIGSDGYPQPSTEAFGWLLKPEYRVRGSKTILKLIFPAAAVSTHSDREPLRKA